MNIRFGQVAILSGNFVDSHTTSDHAENEVDRNPSAFEDRPSPEDVSLADNLPGHRVFSIAYFHMVPMRANPLLLPMASSCSQPDATEAPSNSLRVDRV